MTTPTPTPKPMTPQRMREIAVLLLADWIENEKYVADLRRMLADAEAGKRVMILDRVYGPEEIRRSLEHAGVVSAKLELKRAAAYELQDYSNTMKGR